MRAENVVLRFKDKTLMKGRTSDFTSEKSGFNMRLLSGDWVRVNVNDLKAVFFVKTFNGKRGYTYTYDDVLLWEGSKVRIRFADREIMIGYTSHHGVDSPGFFVTPADLQGNNRKVFVISSAVKEVSYL